MSMGLQSVRSAWSNWAPTHALFNWIFVKWCFTSSPISQFNWFSVGNKESDRSVHGEGNGTPLQHSCLENPMDGRAWWAAVHGVAKTWTGLSAFTFTFDFHALEKEIATHPSVLAWRIPGMGELHGLPSMGSHRVRHDWSYLAAADLYNSFLFFVPGFFFFFFTLPPVKCLYWQKDV